MNATIRFLADFCRDHPLDEKVFVAPSFIVGRQIGEALAREAGSWVNLRFVTLPSLAHETAALELSRLGLRMTAGPELLVFIDVLFRELLEAGRLEYFQKLAPSPGVSQALLRAIGCLRLEGLTSERIEPALFAVAAKGRDLRTLAALYEERLRAVRAVDPAGLYALAKDVAGRGPRARGAHILLSADTALGRVERDFLDAASGERLVLVVRDPVFGLERPRRFLAPGPRPAAPFAAATDADRLPWLFDPEGQGTPKPLGDGSVEIFRALGPVNECREVLRRVAAAGLAFDEVEVVCPPGPAYTTAWHRLSLRTGLPVTFAEGLPLSLTAPGRVLAGLLEWVEKDFPATTLARLVESRDLRLPFPGPGVDVPPSSVRRHLRKAQIGWGRDRYQARLKALCREYEAKAAGAGREDIEEASAEMRRAHQEEAVEAARLAEAVGTFLSWFPDLPRKGPVPYEDLCLGLTKALKETTAARPDPEERNARALDLLTAALRALVGAAFDRPGGPKPGAPEIGLEAALDRIRTAVAALAVGAAAPRPGHLHASAFPQGGCSGRPMTFILGLDDSDFPGHGLQDPILLDAERERLSPELPTTADALREKVYGMAALLASLRGRAVFSYPAYDILEDRRAFPSSLVLQVYRLLGGKEKPGSAGLKTPDYTDLEGSLAEASGFLPGGARRAVDETEWWLDRLGGDGAAPGGLDAVRKHFPSLAEGARAEAARAGRKLSAYEGIVRIDGRRFDPLVNHGLELSASRLESLVKCPFGYFLRYILGIEPPEEVEIDLSRWLDAKDRGSLIHEILHDFMEQVTASGERPDAVRHASLIEAAARRAISRWADVVPPPSAGVFEKECLDIDHALALFLKVEGARPADVRPRVFEKRFSGVPIEVRGRRSFLLKGIIDRIDELGPGAFKVIDYKTGSPKRYQDIEAFGQGRVIQHALYAVAAERVLVDEGLAREPRVVESGYYFPTRRGEGGEVVVGAFDRARFQALLADIIALISNGYFPTTLKDECGTCDYAPVCGGAPARTKGKIEDNPEVNEALERLKAYD